MANFSTNLQFYRMNSGMTQEQLAEKMGVSRQTVSKWESGASYPEMEKLIALCELFGCTLDGLVRGGLPNPAPEQKVSEQEPPHPQVQRADYERVMGRTAWAIAAGVTALIASVAVNHFISAAGVQEAWATTAMFLTVAMGIVVLIAGGSQRGQFRRRYPQLPEFYADAERARRDRWFPFGIGCGISLILIGLCTAVLGEEIPAPPGFSSEFFDGIFLFLAGLGMGVLVFNGLKKDQYNIAKYNQENAEDPDISALNKVDARAKRKNQITGGICGIIMLLATIIFLVTGVVLQAWYISWIVFPVGGILCVIVNILADIFDRPKGE